MKTFVINPCVEETTLSVTTSTINAIGEYAVLQLINAFLMDYGYKGDKLSGIPKKRKWRMAFRYSDHKLRINASWNEEALTFTIGVITGGEIVEE